MSLLQSDPHRATLPTALHPDGFHGLRKAKKGCSEPPKHPETLSDFGWCCVPTVTQWWGLPRSTSAADTALQEQGAAAEAQPAGRRTSRGAFLPHADQLLLCIHRPEQRTPCAKQGSNYECDTAWRQGKPAQSMVSKEGSDQTWICLAGSRSPSAARLLLSQPSVAPYYTPKGTQ